MDIVLLAQKATTQQLIINVILEQLRLLISQLLARQLLGIVGILELIVRSAVPPKTVNQLLATEH